MTLETKIHKNFKLNKHSFNSVAHLLLYSKTISIELHQFLKMWFSTGDYLSVTTSGSTGIPKVISLKKEFMINSAKATGSFFNLSAKSNVLLCLPINYIAGKMMVIRALALGWHIDTIKPNSNPLKNCNKTYDFCAMIPLQVQNSINKLQQIKQLLVGGGFLSKKLEEQLQATTCSVFSSYGMTETSTHIAIKKINNYTQSPQFYKLLPEITIYKDYRDCLVIKCPKISENILFTNDVINLVSNSEFEWLGRYDNMINSGGIKLNPEKIEKKLAVLINERFFVAGILDNILGEKLILIIETKTVYSITQKQNILNKIKEIDTISKYEIPKEIFFLSKFIETESKKVQRKKTLSLLF